MAKELFNSKVEEKSNEKKQELTNKVVIAENYKDQRNKPFGVIIIAILSLLFGGSLTGIFIIFDSFKKVTPIIIDVILWILLIALIIYSVFYYLINKNNPTEAIIYDTKTNDFSIYIRKTREYKTYKLEQIKSIKYRAFVFFPKQNVGGPIPKKPVGDKLIIELTDNTIIKILVLDVFKARRLLLEIKPKK